MKAKKIVALVLTCTLLAGQTATVWAQEKTPEVQENKEAEKTEETQGLQESQKETIQKDLEEEKNEPKDESKIETNETDNLMEKKDIVTITEEDIASVKLSSEDDIETEEQTICVDYPIMIDARYGYSGDFIYTVESEDESICKVSGDTYEEDGYNWMYFTLAGISEGQTTINMKLDDSVIRKYIVTVNPLPDNAIPIKDLALRTNLISQRDSNDDGCITNDEIQNTSYLDLNAYDSLYKNNSIEDLSGLEYFLKLETLYLRYNDKLTDITVLFDLPSLQNVDLRGTNVSDEDRWKLADFQDFTMVKSDETQIPALGNIFEDGLSIEIIDGEDCIKITKDENLYSLVATEGGSVTLKLNYNDYSKEIKIQIQGVNADQELGENFDIEVEGVNNNVTNSSYPDKNLILDSNNQLWQIYPTAKKLRNNVKEYVATWVYYGEDNDSTDYTYLLDTENTLWFDTEKLANDVVKYDGRYALNSQNVLTNIYNTGNEQIQQTKDWISPLLSSNKGIAYLLKTDGTLWKRMEVASNQELQEWEQIDDEVKQITYGKYVKNDGTVFNYDGTESKITEKVSRIDSSDIYYDLEDNCYCYYYYRDWSNDYYTDGYFNMGKIDVIDCISQNGETFVLTDDSKVYKYDVKTEEVTLILDNVIQMQSRGLYPDADENEWAFKLSDGTYYNYNCSPMSKIILIECYPFELVLHEDGLQSVEKNEVAILNDVTNLWRSRINEEWSYYALRTDGTVWDITTVGVPVKVLDLSQSGSSSEELDIKDCEITLSDTNYIYDGTAKEPSVAVKNGEILLTQDVDYTVSYENNINPGTAAVTVTGIGDYTGSITLEFTIQEKTEVENPFVDVSETEYYYDPVLWAYENGIANGMDDNHFQPGKTCTRAQAVTFLWRAMGEPEPESTSNPFTDIKSSEYYYTAVLWAYQNGIVNGITETTFCPDTVVTRAQVVTFLWRAEKQPDATIENPFTDVKSSEYYYDAVLWAYENGITSGATETLFKPTASCTRAQVVTFLYRDMQ